IGRPIGNLEIHLLDPEGEPVAVGLVGELHIGGAGLARGYLGRPGLTAEKFVPDALAALVGRCGARLYRTGDLARWLASGEIEYLGRLDAQVKVRGFRIEPGEIESVLARHPGVRAAAVLVRGEGEVGKRLVAYLEPSGEGELSVAELRAYLAAELPEPMVPAGYVVLPALPVNANGKVDRLALARREDLDLEAEPAGFDPLRTPVEELLCGIWSRLLGVGQVGRQDDFFALGGHSLLATRLMSRVRETFGVELPVRTLFESPTVAGLARQVELVLAAGGAGVQSAPPLLPVERTGPLPLSFAQERMWFLAQLEPEGGSYHLPTALRLTGRLSVLALGRSVAEIVCRHEVLRTLFAQVDGELRQVVLPPVAPALPVVDLRGLSTLDREREGERWARSEASRPFDLAVDPPIRSSLVRLDEESWLALLTLHHIAGDGWSLGVLVEELTTLYTAFSQGLASPLPELPVQYADFAVWQRQWLSGEVLAAQISYWKEELSGAPTVLQLATDRPRPVVRTLCGAIEPVRFGRELSAALQGLSRREGGTLFMTLLSGFAALLSRTSGQLDVLVGTAVANRTRVETEGLIGFFVNTLVLRGRLAESPTFGELLGRTRHASLGAYAHQDLPFERLVEELEVPRSLSHSPLFQVMFMLQNAPRGELSLPGLMLAPVELARSTAKFDLTLALTEVDGELQGGIEYSTDLFDGATVRRSAGHLEVLLRSAAQAPERRVAELPLLGPAERQQLMLEWNDTQVTPEGPAAPELIHQLFERQAARRPQAPAVVGQGRSLSYGELEARANRLARYLRRLGVGAETRVGLCILRSPEMAVALLGILKAGGTYVPLDPAHPAERLALVRGDSELTVLVTEEPLLDRLSVGVMDVARPFVVCLDRDRERIAAEADSPLDAVVAADPDSLAYVIYTSGSTGRPKGVCLPHRAVVSLLLAIAERLGGLDEGLVVPALSTLSFDIAGLEIYLPLALGGRVEMVESEEASDGRL
ncbi:MAG TPA: condensation domain-containing protein, partial [Thermoanaerobaculia bacterium]